MSYVPFRYWGFMLHERPLIMRSGQVTSVRWKNSVCFIFSTLEKVWVAASTQSADDSLVEEMHNRRLMSMRNQIRGHFCNKISEINVLIANLQNYTQRYGNKYDLFVSQKLKHRVIFKFLRFSPEWRRFT